MPSVPAKLPNKNVGGSSKMKWFNQLATDNNLKAALANLVGKIKDTMEDEKGCWVVVGFTEETRPQVDKKFREVLKHRCADCPERFSPYTIALAGAQVLIPERDPPPYPPELRQVKHKRSAAATPGSEKVATRVCSHLCHNR